MITNCKLFISAYSVSRKNKTRCCKVVLKELEIESFSVDGRASERTSSHFSLRLFSTLRQSDIYPIYLAFMNVSFPTFLSSLISTLTGYTARSNPAHIQVI